MLMMWIMKRMVAMVKEFPYVDAEFELFEYNILHKLNHTRKFVYPSENQRLRKKVK